MRWKTFVSLVSVALIGGCEDSTGLDDGRFSEPEKFEWSGEVAPAARIEIKNINGDLRARPGSDGMVRVRAVRQGKNDAPSSVRIEVLGTPQGVTICAVYPDVPGQPPNQCLPGLDGQLSSHNNDVEVTFEIEVPTGCSFFGGTIAGSVEAAGLAGYVHARTLAGDIDISTSGIADAATNLGRITASIGRVGWDRDLAFRTLAGDVTLRVPPGTHADVRGSTIGGSISTDFPLSITQVGGWRILQGRLGNGGRSLTITTGSGDIALLSG
jgi:hypothetical protein